ncbi:ubiquitin carboxy-terminal hydrolase (macronuclear) [Tetrahymena thermophila SB210]|uniref:Ubiquitin carboxy-terminal hydrolase n=1 Tax=Tetrahymena thermophila (strain SB210) TaxID=312017 RepID=Q238T6_TETTS|nr:ubiquitin carboxy-terminal hydrolase [Tetrahymena thermophila SB210]EAR93134.2 ubiquitin carboxy-terminal hydrolase [Tetrahymena thermophila SB210]|eukprot:XP_001013379.2 ubiquitin carboxy-terminal hydrolase [Tetrahymena thermophila SB210]
MQQLLACCCPWFYKTKNEEQNLDQNNNQNNEFNDQRNIKTKKENNQAIQDNSDLKRSQYNQKNNIYPQMSNNNQQFNNRIVYKQELKNTNYNNNNKDLKDLDNKPNGMEDKQKSFNKKENNSQNSKNQKNQKFVKENDKQIQERYNYSNQDKNNNQNENRIQQINSYSQKKQINKKLQISDQDRFNIQEQDLNRNKQDQKFQDKNREIQTYYGIQNLGNTCYINSALQMLRQIYEENEQFLEQRSYFAQNLKEFFQGLSKGYVNRQLLNDFISISNQKQTHEQKGGDSYLTAFNYLSKIINETNEYKQNNINEYKLTQFQQIFTIIFQDGLYCKKCKKYLMDSTDIPYMNEPDSSLDLQNFPKYRIESVYKRIYTQQSYCNQCNQKSKLKTLRSIAFFPQFLIVKLPKSSFKLGKKQQRIKFDKISYQLIGYCNYDGVHYTYTAKQNNIWITYNDSITYQVYKLNLRYSIYQLYKKM